jgi:heat-inducible transcriptional repressor
VFPPRIKKAELSYRARKILYAVIAEYVATGEPVGSRTLARRHGLQLSAASIRNVLSDLEEAGYLTQPHTSAGRVPTDLGLRLFVDALVHIKNVSEGDQQAILAKMKSLRVGEDDVMREAGKLLSELTRAAAVVTPPRMEEELLSQLRFIPLPQGGILAVLVSRSGTVQNRVLTLDRALSPTELDQIHNYLMPLIEGHTMVEIRERIVQEMAQDQSSYHHLRKRTMQVVDAALAAQDRRDAMVIEGQGVLFNRPEFADGEKIRSFLKTFEAKQTLLRLLDSTLAAGGVRVLIGAEAQIADVEDISVISAAYGPASSMGTVAIVGPARMDYGKVMPLVQFTAQVMGDVLEGPAVPAGPAGESGSGGRGDAHSGGENG